MKTITTEEESSLPTAVVTGRIAQLRMLTGVLQGLLLYLLYLALKSQSWPATNGYLFAPLTMIALFIPVLLISALGHLQMRRLLIWMAIAALVGTLLGVCDVWRAGPLPSDWWGSHNSTSRIVPSALLIFFTSIGLYIAHALVLAGAHDRRLVAGYPSYFEIAWKLAIQIKFSLLFVGVLWGILWLGATLFALVKLTFLRDLLQHAWCWIPVTAFAFSTAMHLTDVRPGIVRGIRSLLLVLMSWLLPITALIVGGFLVTLPFVGLAPLWATRNATLVLLGTAVMLILLINATFQGGEIGKDVARVLRVAARVACVLLTPITLIAIYALTLRVQQYGWTSDRVIAAAGLLIISCYASGYLWAAAERNGWLLRVASTNVIAALLIIAVLIGLFTPIADPARLAVADQMARLASGKVKASKFDFDYLRFDGERYGDAALQKLKDASDGPDAAKIRIAAASILAKKSRYDRTEPLTADLASRTVDIQVWPAGKKLPDNFLKQTWSNDDRLYMIPACLKLKDRKCDAYLVDMTGDGHDEILMKNADGYSKLILFAMSTDGTWQPRGMAGDGLYQCTEVWKALEQGQVQLKTPEFMDLQIAGRRVQIEPWFGDRENCAKKK